MKAWLPIFLLLATTAAAQRPTAEAARVPTPFWSTDATTGTVVFRSSGVRPLVPVLAQAEHLRSWLTSTCSTWTELNSQADSTQLYQGQLPGVHTGVALRFTMQVRQQRAGWEYILLAFQVRSPTGDPDLVHWLPLHRLLTDPDFRPDVASFQQQLQQALPML